MREGGGIPLAQISGSAPDYLWPGAQPPAQTLPPVGAPHPGFLSTLTLLVFQVFQETTVVLCDCLELCANICFADF